MWIEREKHINIDYAVIGCMVYLIPYIREDVFKIPNENHMSQMNNVIKTFFDDSSEKGLHETLDTFWSAYTNSNSNIDPFYSNKFIWSSKYICDGNIHLWHHKCSLPSTKVLGFVVFSLTSKIIGMVSPDPSWGDVKTIKSGKISALGSDISDKQSIVYTSALI